MKILISSIACDPFAGSETVHGWRAARAIARDHDVWVLTSDENHLGLNRAQSEGLVPENMRFLFVGESTAYHDNRMIARTQSWLRYAKFNRELLPIAERAHREIRFDLAHHVTYTTWRVASPLWKLGIPLVWGPISGTEAFPVPLFSILSFSAKIFEITRVTAGAFSWISPSVRACARQSAHIVAIHQQAYQHLVKLRGTSKGVSVHSGFFFPDEHMALLERTSNEPNPKEPLKIFGSGHLEGRKGVALALYALAEVRNRGVAFTYRISSRGPELRYLQQLSRSLGLEDCVSLGHSMPFSEYIDKLKQTDVYLLPSLREGGGLTLMEAMLAGCTPIVAQCGGPGQSVTPECGFPLPVTTKNEMVKRIADTIENLDKDRDRLSIIGNAARRRILENYNETKFRSAMNTIYSGLIA
jgi:glycosyltransferase involved in cell wall biosynthesis